MLYSYSFANRKRDLSDVLSSVIKDEPRFISNFRRLPDARMPRHEWIEDALPGRGITATAINMSVLTVSAADAAKVRVGTMLCKENNPALFRVKDKGGDAVVVELAAANGSPLTVETLPENGAKFRIISTPDEGEEENATVCSQWNATQSFRKEIVVSGTALAVNLYGGADNQVNRQTAFALSDLARDLNRVALYGRRIEGDDKTKGEAGGLYYFGTGEGASEIDANELALDSFIIRDAAQIVHDQGGDPLQLVCGTEQARVLNKEYRDRLQILRSDDRRGAYVAVIVNELNGKGFQIIADPDMPDTDAWVIDPAGFGLANLKGRAIADEDATPKGYDGIRRIARGELTFEFRNVKQRCCRIKNLMPSERALNNVHPMYAIAPKCIHH